MSQTKSRAKLSDPFWVLSNWKGLGSRWAVRRTEFKLVYGADGRSASDKALSRMSFYSGPIDPSEIPLFQGNLEFRDVPDDCPWPVADMFICSDRVRQLLELHAPGNCQFFPTKVTANGEACSLVYWVVYVDALDCADQVLSLRMSTGNICDPLLLPEKIPQSTMLFRVRNATPEIYVRDSLRRAFVKAKVSGICFDRVRDPREFNPVPGG